MGKKSLIKSLGKVISNITAHEILFKYTNKPESINFIAGEISEYRDVASQFAAEFNWSPRDKTKIKELSLKEFKTKMSEKYPDVHFPTKEAENLVEKIVEEILDIE